MVNVNWQGGGVWKNFKYEGIWLLRVLLASGAPVHCLSFSINLNQSQEVLKTDGKSLIQQSMTEVAPNTGKTNFITHYCIEITLL